MDFSESEGDPFRSHGEVHRTMPSAGDIHNLFAYLRGERIVQHVFNHTDNLLPPAVGAFVFHPFADCALVWPELAGH